MCGLFGITLSRLMNGGHVLLWPLFPNSVCYAFPTLVSQLNTSFGVAFKLSVLGVGPLSSCMNYVGLRLAIMRLETNPPLGKRFLRRLLRKSRRDIALWIEHNDKVFNHIQWA